MKKTILLILTSLLFIGCSSQPNKKGSSNWDSSKDVSPKQNGKLHGLVKNYDFNGKIMRTTNYSNGVMNGKDTWYNRRNRKVASVIPYVNGKKNGQKISYIYGTKKDPTAMTGYIKTDYLNGEENGFENKYTKEGEIRYSIPYLNGKYHGVKKIWYSDGKLSNTTTYKNGKKDGPQRNYNGDGTLRETVTWSNNVRGKTSYSPATKRLIAENKRYEAKVKKEEEREKKMKRTTTSTSSTKSYSSGKGRTRITQNDGKFIAGVCSDESTFFIEKKNYLYEGSGTNGVCSKSDLHSTISCVCSGG